MNHQQSAELFVKAKQVIPGGVNSPVRAFKSVGCDPIFIARAAGSNQRGARMITASASSSFSFRVARSRSK